MGLSNRKSDINEAAKKIWGHINEGGWTSNHVLVDDSGAIIVRVGCLENADGWKKMPEGRRPQYRKTIMDLLEHYIRETALHFEEDEPDETE